MAKTDHMRSLIRIPEDKLRGFMVACARCFRLSLYAIAAVFCWQIFARRAV